MSDKTFPPSSDRVASIVAKVAFYLAVASVIAGIVLFLWPGV